MFSGSKKPYTAVTVQIERLTSPAYENEDYGGIVDLVEVIRIQNTGPTEAARALRKKLKYGDVHRQLRALTILDGLIQNGGARFQRTFADEPLLERLRILPRDETVDPDVREKCNQLFRQWAVSYKNTPGLTAIAQLYKELPKQPRKRPQASSSRVIQQSDREALEDPFAEEPSTPPSETSQQRRMSNPHRRGPSSPTPVSPSASSPSRSRALSSGSIFSSAAAPSATKPAKAAKSKRTGKPFNLSKEKPQILQALASSNVASTNLLNALKHVNRETTRVSEDPTVMQHFDACRMLRRQILRYIQMVESDEWIGSLLNANDELVKALIAWEIMDRSVDDDSDSEDEGLGMGTDAGASAPVPPGNIGSADAASARLAGLRVRDDVDFAPPAKPPRPAAAAPSPVPAPKPSWKAEGTPTPLAGALAMGAAHGRDTAPASPKKAVRPATPSDEEDDDNPFGDENEIRA